MVNEMLQESPGGRAQFVVSMLGTDPKGPADTKNSQLFSADGYPSDVYSGPIPFGTDEDILSYLSLSSMGILYAG